jgi:hypothetical protein
VKAALFRQMETPEKRLIVKFAFLKGAGSKAIHRELAAIVDSTAYSPTQIKECHARFKMADLSCEYRSRPGRPSYILGKALSDFVKEFRFASPGGIAQHFSQSRHIIREILSQKCGLWRLPEDGEHIRSQRLKRAIGHRSQLICRVSSIAKRIILFLGL